MYRIKKLIRTQIKIFNKKVNNGIGSLMPNRINAFWWQDEPNFGDQLNPSLIRYYGFFPINTRKNDAEVIAIGSVLDNLSADYSGYILGAGLQNDIHKKFPYAKKLAVRGKLTQNRIDAPEDISLGDPGLLADRLLKKRQKKKYTIGIVPHYVDKNDKRLRNILLRNKDDVSIIDVQQKPLQVITEIDKCCFILSSSLHGLVVADSLGIPNAWTLLSNKVMGNGFKFYDYSSAFDRRYEPYILSGLETIDDLKLITHDVPEEIKQIKNDLDSVFLEFKSMKLGK